SLVVLACCSSFLCIPHSMPLCFYPFLVAKACRDNITDMSLSTCTRCMTVMYAILMPLISSSVGMKGDSQANGARQGESAGSGDSKPPGPHRTLPSRQHPFCTPIVKYPSNLDITS